MKTSGFVVFIVLLLLGSNLIAKDTDDATSPEHADESKELVDKKALVKDKEAQFLEKQKRFDAAAEELHAARLEYVREVSESTTPLLQEMIDLSERFVEQASLFAPLASQYAPNLDAMRRELKELNEGVIGVYLAPEVTGGVLITDVTKEGPAANVGLQSGDVIVEVDDVDVTAVDNPYEMTATIISEKGAGDTVRIKINRSGESLSYDVETVDRLTLNSLDVQSQDWLGRNTPLGFSTFGPASRIPSTTTARSLWNNYAVLQRTNKSVHVMEIEEDLGQYFGVEYGVLVLKADDVEGLQPGDILLEIDQQPVRSLSHARRHIRGADEELEIRLRRNKREKTVNLERDQIHLNAILQ